MYDIHDIESRPSVDPATSRAVRDGIGERLRDTMRDQPALPRQLRDLLQSLERQDQSASRRIGREANLRNNIAHQGLCYARPVVKSGNAFHHRHFDPPCRTAFD